MRVLAVAAAMTLAVATPAAGAPSLGSSGCPLFPAANVWHADVSRLPVHPRSGTYLAAMGAGAGIHFEAVDTSGLRISPASAAALGSPRSPSAAAPAAPAAPADPADPAPAPGPTGFIPQLLTAVLGLVAATLAARVVLRTRRPQDQHRGGAPGADVKADAPPDPDPTPTRRR
jgi:hypothetical protein